MKFIVRGSVSSIDRFNQWIPEHNSKNTKTVILPNGSPYVVAADPVYVYIGLFTVNGKTTYEFIGNHELLLPAVADRFKDLMFLLVGKWMDGPDDIKLPAKE